MHRSFTTIVRALSIVALAAVAGCGQSKLKSDMATAVPGCRVEINDGQLKASPCDTGESLEQARLFVTTNCARIRDVGIRHIELASWNSPGYTVMNWHKSENDTCTLRCIGRGC